MATKKAAGAKKTGTKKAKETKAKPATKKTAGKKRSKARNTTEASVSGYPTKQSFVKLAKSRDKKHPRTWVMIYRLVDGPEVKSKKKSKGT